eukprot:5611635-Amphidinium_carterae.1
MTLPANISVVLLVTSNFSLLSCLRYVASCVALDVLVTEANSRCVSPASSIKRKRAGCAASSKILRVHGARKSGREPKTAEEWPEASMATLREDGSLLCGSNDGGQLKRR